MKIYNLYYLIRTSLKPKGLGIFFTCILFLSSSLLMAQDCNDVTLKKADQSYRLGKFEEAKKILNDCLKKDGFEFNEERFSAHKILANIFLITDFFGAAERQVALMLSYNPSYTPNKIDESAQFIAIVNQLKNEKSHNYDALVISASKKEQRASDAPATIHVIKSEQIQARGYISLMDLLEDIPSVEVQRNSSNEFKNSVGIRGISGNEKFMIMMDGIRITPATGDPYAFNHNFSLVNAKRVEVILGPASALYGVDAFSGIINIITKDGNDVNGSNFSSSFGQYNTFNNSFLAGAQSKGLDFTISGQRYSSNGPDYQNKYPDEYEWYNKYYEPDGLMGHAFILDTTIQAPDSYDRAFSMPSTTNYLSANLRFGNFEIGANYYDTQHCPAVSNDPKTAIYTDEAFLKTSMQTAYFQHVYLNEIKNSNQSWSLQSTLSYSNFQMDPNSNFINFFTNYDHGYKYLYSKSTKIEEQFEYVFGSKLSLIAGSSYELLGALPKTSDIDKPVNTKIPTDNQDLYYSGSVLVENGDTVLAIPLDFYYLNYTNYGSYAQIQYKPSTKIEVTAGIRYDYNTRFDYSINPRAGIVLKPIEKLRIKLLYGSAYLAPSPWKAYLSYGSFEEDTEVSEPSLKSPFFHLPNPQLKPEKLQSFEINVLWLENEDLKFSIGGYFNAMNDLISLQEEDETLTEFKNYPIGTIETTQNQGYAQTYGLNVNSVFLNLLKSNEHQLNWYSSYDYSDGFIEVNDKGETFKRDLIASARHTFKSGFDYYQNRFSGNIRMLFRSKSNSARSLYPDLFTSDDASNNQHKHKSSIVLNAHARYLLFEEKNMKGSCFIRISNVLNTRNYHVGVGTDSFRATPQDPIRISAGFKIEI